MKARAGYGLGAEASDSRSQKPQRSSKVGSIGSRLRHQENNVRQCPSPVYCTGIHACSCISYFVGWQNEIIIMKFTFRTHPPTYARPVGSLFSTRLVLNDENVKAGGCPRRSNICPPYTLNKGRSCLFSVVAPLLTRANSESGYFTVS